MKVKLTTELKKQLLQAIADGELETDIFHKEDTRPLSEIEAEIRRLTLLDGEPLWMQALRKVCPPVLLAVVGEEKQLYETRQKYLKDLEESSKK